MSKWLKAAGIRAIKTMAQAFVSFTAGAVVLTDIDWLYIASGSVLAGIISLAMSLAGLPEVDCAAADEELSNGDGDEQ